MTTAIGDALTARTQTKRTRQRHAKRQAMKDQYVRIPIAWLYLANSDTATRKQWTDAERLSWCDARTRLALIQTAVMGNRTALERLQHIERTLRHAATQDGRRYRERYGSIPRKYLDAVCDGKHPVFGDPRSGWYRFAAYVALRSLTSSPNYQAMRASYAQIAALAHGMPTIAQAHVWCVGFDVSPNKALYRKTQRAIDAFVRAGMVLRIHQSGYRVPFYSYHIQSPETARAVAAASARAKAERKAARMLDKGDTPPSISDDDARAINEEASKYGWHDAALTDLSRDQLDAIAQVWERVAGRTYVQLSRASTTEQQRLRGKLHEVIGRHAIRSQIA